MTRLKVSWTIDETAMNWLVKNGGDNISEFVNQILSKEMNYQEDMALELERIERDTQILNEKKNKLREKFNRILDEGSKKDREEAQELLKRMEETARIEAEQKRNNLELFKTAVLKFQMIEDFNKCKSRKDIINFLNSLAIINLNSREPVYLSYAWISDVLEELENLKGFFNLQVEAQNKKIREVITEN